MSSTLGSNLDGNTVLVGGVVHAEDGSQYDVTTESGLRQAQTHLTESQLAELEVAMKANGYTLSNEKWVPRDSVVSRYEQAVAEKQREDLGFNTASDVTSGMTDADEQVSDIFRTAGLANPYNANTTPQVYATLHSTPTFEFHVAAIQNIAADHAPAFPTEPKKLSDIPPGTRLHSQTADFAERYMADISQGNIMEILFLVFRQSIEQTNEDKKYFLRQLQDYNTMAEQLSDYLSELVEESQALSSKAAGAKYPEKVTHSVTVKRFDLSTLDPNGKLVMTSEEVKSLDRAGLNDTIKDVESMQETARNKKQMISTAFQNFDQKANQLYNLMSSVLKVMNEMRSGTIRNML